MKHLLSYLLVAAIAVGCSQKESAYSDDTVAARDSAIMPPQPPEPPVEVVKVLDHSISQAEEAMEFMRSSEHWEEYQQGVIPRIAEQNVEYAMKLLANKHPYFVIVDKRSMYVILYNRYGEEIDRYRMCCSRKYGTKHAKRDNRTPEGFFTAGLTYDSTDWLYTDDDGKTSKVKGQFGPRFIRITNPVTTQVGIHGTCAPWSLGGRSSHGCIRIHNDNIMKLVEYVTPGTPVIINPSDRDQEVNREEGYEIVQLQLGKKRPKPKETPDTTQRVTEPEPVSIDSVAECDLPPQPQPEPSDTTTTIPHIYDQLQ